MPARSLFSAIKRAGIKHACHESDLYVPDNPRTRRILKRFSLEARNASRFRNQREGGTWIDVPFACVPFWERKARR